MISYNFSLIEFISLVEGILDGKMKSSKTAKKKGGLGHGSRKALNDITNKSSLHHEASSKKMNIPKEELNVAEEMFLHDHRKCIEAQKSALNTFYLDLVLPGQGDYTRFSFQYYFINNLILCFHIFVLTW